MKYIQLILFFLLVITSCKSKNSNQNEEWLNNKHLYQAIVKAFFANDSECIRLDSVIVLDYDLIKQIQSRENNFKSYFNNADTIYINLMKQVYELGIVRNGNLLASVECSNKKKSILFTNPVYNQTKDKAIVYIKLNCGNECAETQLLLLELSNNSWQIKYKNTLSVI